MTAGAPRKANADRMFTHPSRANAEIGGGDDGRRFRAAVRWYAAAPASDPARPGHQLSSGARRWLRSLATAPQAVVMTAADAGAAWRAALLLTDAEENPGNHRTADSFDRLAKALMCDHRSRLNARIEIKPVEDAPLAAVSSSEDFADRLAAKSR